MNYKLTIVMASYNHASYIRQSIDSILMQKTTFPYQLIIIDDKSTDESLLIAEEYAQKYPDIIKLVKNKKNIGYLATTFDAYDCHLKTDYFAFLDPDDYWVDENFLQKSFAFLEKNLSYTMYSTNPNLLYSDGRTHPYTDNKKLKKASGKSLNSLVTRILWMQTSGVVFRNVIFKNGIPKRIGSLLKDSFNPRILEGDSFRNLIHNFEGKNYFVNECCSVYRIHDKGIWSNSPTIQADMMNLLLYYTAYLYCGERTPLIFFDAFENLWKKVYENPAYDNLSIEERNKIREIFKIMNEAARKSRSNNLATFTSKSPFHMLLFRVYRKLHYIFPKIGYFDN